MGYKWREAETPLFLNLYKKYECLWNNKSKSYKNKTLRDDALRAFCCDLNIPGLTKHDIKLKIKTIRTRYMAELHKVTKSEKSAVGPDNIYVPNLFWYAQANSFLHEVSILKENISNLDYPEFFRTQKSDLIEEHDDNMKHAQHFENEISEDTVLDEENNIKIEIKTENIYDDIRKNDDDKTLTPTTFKKWETKRSYISDISSFERVTNKLPKLSEHTQNDENEFDLFCKSLAIQLKKMPLHRALRCQEKLQSVMTEERLSQMVQAQPTQSQTYYDQYTGPNNN
ncbi:hypothetical protein NQ314_002170 [Rhamnusium bicolor]|uniref:MADF domain-containing protein n=1 Tax=Rhamnusium bicolor TaxID=1586634 RepID=A0AAV8ZRK8_9CUCU|nr:hypothetical protein NQ314_002170 [Rhamnusium bicolor]